MNREALGIVILHLFQVELQSMFMICVPLGRLVVFIEHFQNVWKRRSDENVIPVFKCLY